MLLQALDQPVVGIEMVHVLPRDELVFHKDGRRSRLVLEDVGGCRAPPDDARPLFLFLLEVCDPADHARVRLAQFGAPLRLGVLADDGAVVHPLVVQSVMSPGRRAMRRERWDHWPRPRAPAA